MKIKGIKINGFGKLIDKDYKFVDSINLIQGKNESGKSTIMGFLNSVFFGIQKTRKKDVISDDVRYMPWNTSEFSGLIQYELDNGETYTVFRDFENKKVSVLDAKNQDITKKYATNRETGSNFMEEQTGIDKASFAFSSYTMQNSVVLNSTDKTQMVQKLSNLISTGEDNISYKKLEKKIQDKRREEVGTTKTLNMPMNQVDKKISSVKQEVNDIKEKHNNKNSISEEEKITRKKFNELELKRKLIATLKENKIMNESNVKVINSLKENIQVKKDSIRSKLESKHDVIEKDSFIRKNSKVYLGIGTIAIIVEILVFLLLEFFFKTEDPKKIVYSLIPVPLIALIAVIVTSLKQKRNIDSEYDEKSEENRSIEREINAIRKEVMMQEKEIAKLEKMKENEETKFKRETVAEFCGNLNDNCLQGIMNYDLEKLNKEEKIVESEYTQTMFKLSNVDAKKVIANTKMEQLVNLEEKLKLLEEEKRDLEDLNEVYETILSGLKEAYEEMKESISPSFVNNLSKITKSITDGQYKSIILSEDQKILVQLGTGEYIDLEKLSTGTIEQINFALRLSILKEITDEKIPILLDETFVFYDEDRLRNVLDYLVNVEERQVILFTCSNREKEIFDQNNISYNYIEMR